MEVLIVILILCFRHPPGNFSSTKTAVVVTVYNSIFKCNNEKTSPKLQTQRKKQNNAKEQLKCEPGESMFLPMPTLGTVFMCLNLERVI